MTPQVVPSLQGHNISQVRGGQHHALALTQVPLPCCLPINVCFGMIINFKSLLMVDLHLVFAKFTLRNCLIWCSMRQASLQDLVTCFFNLFVGTEGFTTQAYTNNLKSI